ncbi:MAG: FAD-dependent oxidoreductase [Acidobacteriota bacterium]|jgi:formate dehydrogenase major subunit|nr:FAD-dependent oxidoreductase [Acidobacteriota bacterium]
METITLTINGQEVISQAGKTILEVVNEHKLDRIPTLCHDPRLEPYGSCFLCVVEVAGLKKLVPACATLATEGMIVETDNPRIRSSRKTALELLLSNHYADCIGPCIDNCPAHVDAQGYVALISMGRYEEALKLVKENNPLPLCIGRVCVRDCEAACRRQIVDEPVAINHLKRFIADKDAPHKWTPSLPEPNGKTVAVVGGGPAGLTCAYYLTLRGYKVDLFEKLPNLGGMMRYGIPEYRLPKAIMDEEIAWITGLGVEVRTGVELGRDITIAGLKNQYDAVFLAVGAHRATTMRLEHEDDTEGVLKGIDFLRRVQMEGPPRFNGTVAVVGGGNTAIDAARTALRCGAEKVVIVYRRSLREMPAHEEEIEAARHEGVEFHFLTNPKSIVRENGRLKGVECLRMSLQEVEDGGRPRPVPIPGSEFVLECGTLIGAIGQQVDTDFNGEGDGCELEKWGTIRVNEKTLETSIPDVFAGGDVVSGPWTAIGAIAQGKRAALAIDRKLRTGSAEGADFHFASFKHHFHDVVPAELQDVAIDLPRQHLPELPPKERIRDFREVEGGYSREQAQTETRRCLECGCVEYYDCRLRQYADEFGVDTTVFRGETREYKVDRSHPLVVNDPNKCISCGRCVRMCTDELGVAALGFVHRGFYSVVKPALEKPLIQTPCVACGNCIDTCPTGALAEHFPHKILGTLAKENMPSVCQFCSLGCNVNFKVIASDLFYVANSTDEVQQGLNKGILCAKGRFGHRFLTESKPFALPYLRRGDKHEASDWQTAMDRIQAGISGVVQKHGAQSVGVFVSPRWTNAAQYLAQKLARNAIGTYRLGSFSYLDSQGALSALNRQLGATISTANLRDLETAAVIAVLPGVLEEESLVVEYLIRRARKRGARLVVLGESGDRMAAMADLWLTPRPGTAQVLFYTLLQQWIAAGKVDPRTAKTGVENWKELRNHAARFGKDQAVETCGISSEYLDQWLDTFADPDQAVVWLAPATRENAHDPALAALVDTFLARGILGGPGSGWILLDRHANAAGARELGITPDHLPGFLETKHAVDLKNELDKGLIKAAIILGEDPVGAGILDAGKDQLEFVVAMDRSWTETLERADVALPAVSCAETDGTLLRCDGTVQYLNPVVSVEPGRWNWRVVARLGARFGDGFDFVCVEDVAAEIRNSHPLMAFERPDDFRGASLLEPGGPLNRDVFRFACVEPATPAPGPGREVIAAERYFKEKIRAGGN